MQAGQQLQHYTLIEQIGEGGMGVVWKAKDTTLARDVAIKILPAAFATDADRRSRFEREAKLLATLNDPGIAGVYGLHEAEGISFIAMEFVPGEDLAQRLKRGPLPADEAIDVARQVAAALETAHQRGIIHRDLKPANIKLTPEGKVKVLDLGLAKALETESSADPGSMSFSPTVTSAGTIAGTLLGTAAYMSPEQVKGKEADRRADIWAFGVVLHELLTGRATFAGETISETLASVLRDDVSDENMPAEIPASVRRLLTRCLDRDPKTRLQDIGEARIALSPEGLAAGGTAAATTAAHRRTMLPWVVAAVALLALVAVSWFALRGPRQPRTFEIRAEIAPPKEHHFLITGSNAGSLSISPDGTRMTFVASSGSGTPSLYLRTLGSSEPRILSGTEGATYPFWSPDSRQLGFFAEGKLKKLDLDGGAPLTVAVAGDGRGGTWNEDGTILFAPDTQSPIKRVSTGGVLGEDVTKLDPERGGETTHRHPSFLPDGRHFLYVRGSHSAADADPVNSIWVGDVESDDTFELTYSMSQAHYAQGHVFWVNEGFLMARGFSAEKLEFTGEGFAVGEGVVMQPNTWIAAFVVSGAGPILFQTGLTPERQLTWFDRQGQAQDTIGNSGEYDFIRLSPDDRSLAVTLLDGVSGQGDIWVYDLQRNVGSRLTFDEAHDVGPVWSPDGSRIAFASKRGGAHGIYVRAANGRGKAELLYANPLRSEAEDWSSDGKYIAFNSSPGKADLWIYSLEDGTAEPFVTGDFDEGYARFAPNGEWIAYVSNESGRYELFLTRFPSGEGKWQLTRVGADWTVGWKKDGSEIFYIDLEGKLCSVKVELSDRVVADIPNCLFPTQSGNSWTNNSDGERFVLGVPDDQGSDYPITLLLNWDGQ
ncbi:MAG: serine/threonine-protein kinase [Acidobacteriota bacterium]|nr:serine/threonine-protein kinase [Acidobacteriota bacterium]MDH3783895.1 serine/threonine-protein kinase [Acidobacteriota bacterium]